MGARWLKELAIDKPVREHIQAWEEKVLNLLSEQVMDESNAGRRHQLETELRAVQSALRFYSGRAGD
jgi:predicted outer membrane protein